MHHDLIWTNSGGRLKSVIVSGVVKVILSYQPGNREPSFSRTAVWTTVHCCTGVTCTCLPICWPIFVRLTKLKSSTRPAVSSIRKRRDNFSSWSSVERGRAVRGVIANVEGSEINRARDYYELPSYNTGTESFAVSTIERDGQ